MSMTERYIVDDAAALAAIAEARADIDGARERLAWLVSAARWYGVTLESLAPALGVDTKRGAHRIAALAPGWPMAPEAVQRDVHRALGVKVGRIKWVVLDRGRAQVGPEHGTADAAKRAAQRTPGGVVYVVRPNTRPRRWTG